MILHPTDPEHTLLSGLSGFFEALTAEKRRADPDGFVRMALRTDFQFPLNHARSRSAGPPLMFAPEIHFLVATDWKPNGGSFVERLEWTLLSRVSSAGLPLPGGRFTMTLRVFSTLKGAVQTVPIVTYREIVYENAE